MTNLAEGLEALAQPIDTLELLDGNPRVGDVEAVAASLRRFGQRKPIVARRSDRQVIAGNHTLKAARSLGWTEIAVVLVDDDDATAKAFALADNRTAELGGYDDDNLAAMIREVGEHDAALLADTGWDCEAVDRLLEEIAAAEAQPELEGDPDEVPESAPARTVLGDVWLCGNHRVMCGDSTSAEAVAKLMGGAKADMVWTDPPYGVAYTAKNAMLNAMDGGNRLETGIESDELDTHKLEEFLRSSLSNTLASSRPGASWWVAAPALAQPLRAFVVVLCELDVWRSTLVWVKDGFVLGRSDYHGRHEQLLYGWAPGGPHTPPPDRSQDSVWEVPRPRKNDLHPTMKPVELIERAITNHTKHADVVLDPFGGSGSTLIAAHSLNRTARLMELDPTYVDVICARFQRTTGIVPILEATGEPHDFTEATP